MRKLIGVPQVVWQGGRDQFHDTTIGEQTALERASLESIPKKKREEEGWSLMTADQRRAHNAEVQKKVDKQQAERLERNNRKALRRLQQDLRSGKTAANIARREAEARATGAEPPSTFEIS